MKKRDNRIFLIVFFLCFLVQGWAQEPVGRLYIAPGYKNLDSAALVPLPYAQFEMGQRYHLMDCIEAALEENFSVRIARNQLEVAKNNVSLSPFLPSLYATARQSQTRNQSEVVYFDDNKAHVDSRTDDYRGGLSFSWRLFDGFAMFSSYAKQKELLQSGELGFRSSVETMVME
jgi:outer membrane protein TolC